ncbi:MAG TPA: hypothetical protein VFK80_01415, partial [Limnochordia bacterium]|nr:hypothetical protein [Limnochordia bacterium]
ALAAVWVATATAGDCYPELWEAATRAFALKAARRRRQRGQSPAGRRRAAGTLASAAWAGDRARAHRTAAAERAPSGEWTLLWKAWLSARRIPGPLLGPIQLTALGVILGAGAGVAVRLIPGVNPYPLAGTAIYAAVIFTVVRAGEQLGADLGKSLWWLSDAPLRNRLLVHTLSGALIAAAPVGAGLLALGLVGNAAPLALLGVPLALSGFWLLRAAGLAVYALMPSGLDMRGPGAMLRIVGVILLAAPIGAVAAGGWLLLKHLGLPTVAAGGIVLAVVVAAAVWEGWLLVVWCAGRVLGRGLDFARAEGR